MPRTLHRQRRRPGLSAGGGAPADRPGGHYIEALGIGAAVSEPGLSWPFAMATISTG